MILIVSNTDDPHVDLVARELDRLGSPWVRFNTDTFPRDVQVVVRIRNRSKANFEAYLCFPDRVVEFSELHAIWYRRPVPPEIDPEVTDPAARRIAQAEAQSLLRQLWASALDVFWMSYPPAIRRAEQKLLQLRVAQELGLLVPDSLITQDAFLADSFFTDMGVNGLGANALSGDNNKAIALKTISGVILQDEGAPIRAVYTQRLIWFLFFDYTFRVCRAVWTA